jgi:hypothetical protein
MLKQLYSQYCDFLDTKLRSNTLIVALVSILICIVGIFIPTANANDTSYMKWNILQARSVQDMTGLNRVMINGEEYEVIFSKISE